LEDPVNPTAPLQREVHASLSRKRASACRSRIVEGNQGRYEGCTIRVSHTAVHKIQADAATRCLLLLQYIGEGQQRLGDIDQALLAVHGELAQGRIGLVFADLALAHQQAFGALDQLAFR
jgi:hypothetical protein